MKRYPAVLLLVVTMLFVPLRVARSDVAIPKVSPEDRICFALYTVHDRVLKMTAQLYPLEAGDSRIATLLIKKDGKWQEVAQTRVTELEYGNPARDRTWTAHFRVENWDTTRDWRYRVSALEGVATYEGLIRRDPVDKSTISIAAFTGNSIYKPHGGDIPRTDIVANIKKLDPDLLFFSGDQVYDHKHHLGYWLRFGRDFGDVIRDRPTVAIPDDHDVGQANLWGAGGKVSHTGAGHDGGYFMPAAYVKAVEMAQTWHLPDPYDPTPIEQGIGVYYTDLRLGRVGFAIIEDRKFKSGPQGLVPQQGPRPDHIQNPNYDPQSVDVAGAQLLGPRQLTFLRQWGQDWCGVDMKAVLSQTIFCGGAHVHGKIGGRLHADMDSNGWPQTGRNKALAEIRRCFAVHIAGDQHLATIFHHGIDDWEDACYSFCVPSIANLYLRWWEPLTPGLNRLPGAPAYSGRHFDGFHNRVTCFAAANPSKEPNGGGKLTTRAAGFGLVRFDTRNRTITFNCWPRNVDVLDPTVDQYPGWPKTIQQTDNYGRRPIAYLPILQIQGRTNPVVQIIDESNDEVVYALRILGNCFRPKVFGRGAYTVVVGEGRDQKTLRGVKALASDEQRIIEVVFDAPGQWSSLFDGKTLGGWTQRNGTATYRVEGNAIVGRTTEGSPNSFLCSDQEYGDFDLTFEVKVDNALNSGVQIRSQTRGGFTGRVNGPQIEIEASGAGGAEAGYIYGEAAGGWMTPKEKLVPHKHFKDGHWNAYRVLAKGPRIRVWINDVLISDLTHEDKFESHPRGFLGLQVHGIRKGTGPYEVRWRNLYIRELDN